MDIAPIASYIADCKNKAVKSIDFDKSKVSYVDEIKQHREIRKISGDEEIVRAYLLTRLVNELGYKPARIEIEKEYDIGRPKVNKPRIDIVLRDSSGDAFLYIETKSPDDYEKNKDEVIEKQLFSLAAQEVGQGKKVKYLVLYSFDVINGEVKEKAIIIDYEKYASFDAWKAERNFADGLPSRYGRALKEPYTKDGAKDLETEFSHDQLETTRKSLHNVLWGGGGTDDNEVFASLTNLILAKIQDESEKKSGEKYDFQAFAFEKEGDEEFETNEDLFERINLLYRRALKQRLGILDEARLAKSYVIDENKFSLPKLKYTVQELQKLSFVDGKSSFDGKDVLGDFFEGIIRDGFKQTKGQFFTHLNVVRFLLWGLKLDELAIQKVNSQLALPYLIDPSAGSGTFLIEYMKFITKNLKYRFRSRLDDTRDVSNRFHQWFLPDHRENNWTKDYIYGAEINFNLGTAAKVNMILHGDGSTNVYVRDGLLPFHCFQNETAPSLLAREEKDELYSDKSVNTQFDVIVTNPPFSVDLDNETKENVKNEFVFGDKKNSENLFVERWYQLLKPGGRLGAVLPDSVFDTTENKYIRLFLYKYFNVRAVVSLPQLTFEPYTSTKTSLLFAQKKSAAEIRTWNELWSNYKNEWSALKTRCSKEIQHFVHGKPVAKSWAIAKEDEGTRKKNVLRLLKDCLEEGDDELGLPELVKLRADRIESLCEYDKGTTDTFGFVNTWWVFGEVAASLNYSIFMAELDDIGYKRTKRGEKPRPNELFRLGDDGEICVDDGVVTTALDKLREVSWD